MDKTVVAEWIGKEKVGYWVGFFLSPENQAKIADLQSELHRELPGVIWTMPDITQQHVTLFEIIMTTQNYPEDADVIFNRYYKKIDTELKEELVDHMPVKVTLDILEASPSAIIIRGTDDGSFQKIRDSVINKNLLPDGTRRPPDIIHSSIARYIKEVDLARVKSIVSRHHLKLTQTVTEFKMVRIWRMPMDYKTLETYRLSSINKFQ